jgi:hypothetical protein
MRVYKTLVHPLLCYGSEAWTIWKSDESKHPTAGCTKWDLKRNEEVLKELKVESVLDYICRYQNNWREQGKDS